MRPAAAARTWLIGRSSRLPVPLLLAVRVAARRPRRFAASMLRIRRHCQRDRCLLSAHATLAVAGSHVGRWANPDRLTWPLYRDGQEDQVLLIVTILLVARPP